MKGMSEEYYQRQIKDLNLRIDNLEFQRNMKQEKIEQLQSNWNSLREWLEEEYKKYDIGTKTYGQAQVEETLNKMKKLEGGDK